MYVVKVGEYYVKGYDCRALEITIVLSKEIMRGFDKAYAEKLAKMVRGEVIEITEEVTND